MQAGEKRMLEGLRVLHVEDKALLAMDYKDMLEAHGAVVVSARNASEATQRLSEGTYDVFLLDLFLSPSIQDGFPLLKTCKEKGIIDTSTCRVIVLSGYSSPGLLEEAQKLGVHEYLYKEQAKEQHGGVSRLVLALCPKPAAQKSALAA